MHSCWSIFNSVLLAFGLNVFDSNSLVKMLWKIIIKKKGKPSQPPGPNPFPPARFPFPHRTAAAQTAQAGALPLLSHRQPGPARQSPLSHLPSSSLPCSSRKRFLTESDPRIPRFPCQARNPTTIKLLASLPRHVFASRSPKPSPRALFREFWISPGALSAAARGHAPLLALGPSQAPSFVRGELLALPVFSFQKTVLGKEKPRSSGEFSLSGHGGHRIGQGEASRPPPRTPGAARDHPTDDQRPRLEHTCSQGIFIKSPWKDWLITPRSLAPWHRLRFL